MDTRIAVLLRKFMDLPAPEQHEFINLLTAYFRGDAVEQAHMRQRFDAFLNGNGDQRPVSLPPGS
jgi:hypothetical protein